MIDCYGPDSVDPKFYMSEDLVEKSSITKYSIQLQLSYYRRIQIQHGAFSLKNNRSYKKSSGKTHHINRPWKKMIHNCSQRREQ